MPQNTNSGRATGSQHADLHRAKVALSAARMALAASNGAQVHPAEIRAIAADHFLTDLTETEAQAGIRAALLPENVTELPRSTVVQPEPEGIAAWHWKTRMLIVGAAVAAFVGSLTALWIVIRMMLAFESAAGFPGWLKAVAFSFLAGALIRLGRDAGKAWAAVKGRAGSFIRWAEQKS